MRRIRLVLNLRIIAKRFGEAQSFAIFSFRFRFGKDREVVFNAA